MIAEKLTDQHSDQPTSHEPHPAELPSTSDTDDLLDAFLHWNGSLFDFARSIGFTIMQVLAWWNLEETQAAVKALETLSDARTKLLARLHAPAAIECASKVSEDPTVKPPERRRAAALILRHAAHRAERRKPPVNVHKDPAHADPQPHEPAQRTDSAPGTPPSLSTSEATHASSQSSSARQAAAAA